MFVFIGILLLLLFKYPKTAAIPVVAVWFSGLSTTCQLSRPQF